MILFLTRIIGYNYAAYFWISVLINAFTAFLMYKIANKGTNGIYIGISASIVYTVAIYSYYGITQVYGIMEQMCVLFCVLFFNEMMLFCENESKLHFGLSVVCFCLALFTHERFLVLFGVLFLQILLFQFKGNTKKKFAYILIASIPMDIFIFVKKIIFQTKIFQGTAQTTISISPIGIIKNLGQTIASLVGFNYGSMWIFGGYNFSCYNLFWKIMTIAIIVVLFIIFIVYFYKRIIKNEERFLEIKYLALFVFMIGGSMLCYCVSERIEMRQMYVPYAILIIYICYFISQTQIKSHLKEVILAIVSVTLLVNGANYQKYLGDLFFMRTMAYTKEVYDETMEQGEDNISGCKIYVYNQADLIWGMMATEERNIYDLYWDDADVETIVWSDIDELNEELVEILSQGEKAIVLYPKSYDEIEKYIVDDYDDLEGVNLLEMYG